MPFPAKSHYRKNETKVREKNLLRRSLGATKRKIRRDTVAGGDKTLQLVDTSGRECDVNQGVVSLTDHRTMA